MQNADFYLTMALSALAGLAMVTMAGLSGWRSWLSLRSQQLQVTTGVSDTDMPTLPNASARIEIADLKERIRKLEAIAAGVDL